MRNAVTLLLAVVPSLAVAKYLDASETAPEGWTTASPRDEIRPQFRFEPEGGPGGKPALCVIADPREGLDGAWVKTFPVSGGRYYRFRAVRKVENVGTPRRSAVAKITWQDDSGKLVPGRLGLARPEYPFDRGTDERGWTEVGDTYQVPEKATRAVVELHLRWAAGGTVRWSDVSLEEVPKPAPRTVRLATVHFRPSGGKSPDDNRRMFEPLIAKAARQKADLVCLGECVTLVGNGMTHVTAAEPIPGPSTEYFGRLAKQHNLYIVVGLTERVKRLVYNVAVLIGPDGKIVGKYRKVCLPREEIEAGVTPGRDYPVFDTRFGKIGMMVCWDVHFPEVARNLANRGAEVIALPIWGGNPLLAQARAVENQVYLVTSTYTARGDWMKTGIINPRGQWIAEAGDWGDVLVAEVNLDEPIHWDFLGNFKARIPRERPEE